MTERLYDADSHIRVWEARVLSCAPRDGAWELTLDRSAVFPGGGGQEPDTALVSGVPVRGWGERDGAVLHRAERPLPVGETVSCALDWETRFSRMQLHSGEHILSGLVHSRYGYDNVGFHMGERDVTVDFSGPLSPEQLEALEAEVNRVIWSDVPVTLRFPEPEELDGLTYRSKLALRENVRLVTVEGVDCCACCAPHVRRTGEIGLLKVLESSGLRGGTRVHMLAGQPAMALLGQRFQGAREVSALLSVPPEAVGQGAARYVRAHEALLYRYVGLRRELLTLRLGALTPTDTHLPLFFQELEREELRRVAETGAALTPGICAVFAGSDQAGYACAMASRDPSLPGQGRRVFAALRGRGGGRQLLEGTVAATEAEIRAFFQEEPVGNITQKGGGQ